MNRVTNTAAGMPEPGKPCNPHCAPHWPFNVYGSQDIAGGHHAVMAALQVARLLAADDLIREDMECSATPEDEPQPFTSTYRVSHEVDPTDKFEQLLRKYITQPGVSPRQRSACIPQTPGLNAWPT